MTVLLLLSVLREGIEPAAEEGFARGLMAGESAKASLVPSNGRNPPPPLLPTAFGVIGIGLPVIPREGAGEGAMWLLTAPPPEEADRCGCCCCCDPATLPLPARRPAPVEEAESVAAAIAVKPLTAANVWLLRLGAALC